VPVPDPLGAIADRLEPTPGTTRILAVAGPVAVGKSTIAAHLADHLRADGDRVAVVSTDGFLHPNAVLEGRGLLERKGYPETYDLDRLEAVVTAARTGGTPLEVPVYSHEHYDVLESPEHIDRPDVLVVEGVVALQRPFADLGVYIHAEEAHVVGWYVARFQALVEAAGDDPTSFYRAWTDLDETAVGDLARAVWDGVNHPNLLEHIAPTRARADVVIHKGADHRILSLEWADP
jgi:type I pantothenate kinase